MRSFTLKHRLLAAVTGVAVLAVAGIAVAYWTSTGSGTGTGTAGTAGDVTLTGTINGEPAPGVSQPVSFTAANPSDSPIRVGTVHLVSVSVDGDHAACETEDFSMANVIENHQVPGGATAEALPNDGSFVYINTAVSQDACQGATLTLSLTSS